MIIIQRKPENFVLVKQVSVGYSYFVNTVDGYQLHGYGYGSFFFGSYGYNYYVIDFLRLKGLKGLWFAITEIIYIGLSAYFRLHS